jgi:opacity protein-like surface antigen
MFFRKFLVLVFVFACAAPFALAQDQNTIWQKLEVTPFGGYKFGGKINADGFDANPEVENIFVKSNIDYGVIADYNIWSSFAIEFMLDRQPTIYSQQDFTFLPPLADPLARGALTTYTFGGAFTFRGDSKVRPFVAGGLGWTNFGNLDSMPSQLFVGFNNRLAFNLGGGVKYYFNNFLGLRFDMRWVGSRTTPTVEEECEGVLGCEEYSANYRMNQGSANLGLIIRF